MENKEINVQEENEEMIEKSMEEMMEALEKMAKNRRTKAQKRKVTNNLVEIANASTKDELKAILTALNIKFKASDKKDGLIESLKVNYKDAVSKLFTKIDSDVYEDLKVIEMNNGVLNKKFDKTFKENSYLEQLGVLYLASDEEKNICLVAPEEVLEAIKSIKKKDLEKNDRIVKLLKGMTHYYGFVSLDEFIDNLPEKEDLKEEDIRLLFLMVEDINRDGLFLGDKWKNEFLEYSTDFENLIESENLAQENYKRLSSEDLIKASAINYIGEKNIYKPFSKILSDDYKIPSDDIVKMLQEIYMYSQLHSEDELKSFILSQIKPPEFMMVKINDALHKVYNRIPLWKYRGFTTLEKFNPELKVIKVGRNDKCPCGSGKKYKKCCGK